MRPILPLEAPARTLALLGALLLAASPAAATVIGGAVTGGYSFDNGGVFVKLTVPFTESDPDNTVGQNSLQSLNLFAFDEDQNIVLPAPLDVSQIADGMGGSAGEGTLAAGTTVASHYIAFDPAGSIRRSQVGTVTFDSDILAVISSSALLTASDFLANTGVTYQAPGLRGLEGGDSVTITGLREVTVDWAANTPGDYVRVLTTFSPVPEPGPVALLACAAAAFAFRTRGRR